MEELSTYDLHYFGGKTAATTYDFPEHAPSSAKKDRKWSFGNLFFRRSKKKDDSDTSSAEEELKKNFLNRKKPKDKRKKEKRSLGNAFDHIVPASNTSTSSRQSNKNGFRMGGSFEDGVLSDPSGCFDSYLGRPLPRPPHNREISSSLGNSNSVGHLGTPTSVHGNNHQMNTSLGSSADSLTKKHRKERTKARAVARRDSFNRHSSSDEEDSRSASSSKFRSDESLSKRDHSASRRSRLARTERYARRLSKDDVSILNREAMQRQARENWQIRVRDDYSPHLLLPTTPPQIRKFYTPPNHPSPNNYNYNHHFNGYYNYSPTTYEEELHALSSQNRNSGLFTIPPSHHSHSNKFRNSSSQHAQLPYNEANSIMDMNGSRLSMLNSSGSINHQYHQGYQPNNQNSKCFNIRSLSCDSNIHKSPSPEGDLRQTTRTNQNSRYRNLSLVEQPRLKQPPPPPPRDPRRMVNPQNPPPDMTRPSSQWYPNLNNRRSQFGGYRTNSEDVIPTFDRNDKDRIVNMVERPASAMTHDMGKKHPGVAQDPDKFKYLTEKRPRSRKPIFIQSTDRINSTKYNGSSSPNQNNWKPAGQAGALPGNNDRQSPQIFTAQTHVQTKIFLPSTVSDNKNIKEGVDTVDFCKTQVARQNSPFKPISPTEMEKVASQKSGSPKFAQSPIHKHSASSEPVSNQDEPCEEIKRKSANLEEALDELEAIYKSLHLGDEDLLERAEQREMDIHAQKLLAKKNETISGQSPMMNSGHFSDSSFSYEPYCSVDTPHKKKSRTLERDRRNDDMALRKMKDGSDPTKTPFKSLANVSYLLASPVHFEPSSIEDDIDIEDKSDKSEPDITYDDVVYRIVKHANNTLKVADPQPPFGIPIGPVTLAANSDYLHAVPEKISYIPYNKNKIPDIVKDDLAYRNLRKDANKEPALKPVSPVNFDINGFSKDSKKKRAVRSLSANISNLINQDSRKNRDGDCENEFKKTRLTDIADAMEIARQILKEKENRIQATKRAFLSDSETKYRAERPSGISASSTETITESRLNFLNEMRSLHNKSRGHSEEDEERSKNHEREALPKAKFLGDDFVLSKPPRGATPDRRFNKESTPTPTPNISTSPETTPRKDSLNSSFEELLTALAVEARETSDRITNELNTLDDNLKRKESKEAELNESTKQKCDEIDAVSEHAKLCEKLLECVVESTELIASTKVEAPPEEEEVVQIDEHLPCIPQSKANIVTTRIDVVDVDVNPVDVVEVHSSSEHDYDNLISDYEDASKMSRSPFEEHKAELIASFRGMKSDLSDTDDQPEVVQAKPKEGERCVRPADNPSALPDPFDDVNNTTNKNTAFVSEVNLDELLNAQNQSEHVTHAHAMQTSFVTNCDIFIDDYPLDGDEERTPDDDCDSQPSSGFHSNGDADSRYFSNSNLANFAVDQIPETLLETLESPRLVTSVMKACSTHDLPSTSKSEELLQSITKESPMLAASQNFSDHCKLAAESTKSTAETSRDKNCSPSNDANRSVSCSSGQSRNNNSGNANRSRPPAEKSKSRTWYGDPMVLAFACSYGVACSYQLATLDVVTILGIVFLIISIAVALILE